MQNKMKQKPLSKSDGDKPQLISALKKSIPGKVFENGKIRIISRSETGPTRDRFDSFGTPITKARKHIINFEEKPTIIDVECYKEYNKEGPKSKCQNNRTGKNKCTNHGFV